MVRRYSWKRRLLETLGRGSVKWEPERDAGPAQTFRSSLFVETA
jgi:hypothetical protein